MDNQRQKWTYLAILSIIWGSSFILIKKGLNGLTAFQLGSIRILFTGFFLLAFRFKAIKQIEKKQYIWIVLTALLGTFIPVYCFALAETQIDSAIASILNSLTPLNTLIFGYFVFNITFYKRQLLGVVVGLTGTLLLIANSADINPDQNYWYSLFVIAASVCYAFNVNVIKKHLQDVSAMSIAVGNFFVLMIPAVIVLIFTDFFNQQTLNSTTTYTALGYVAILSLFGTAIAKVMFNKLVQISSPIFSSSVTYTIPIIALFWGILDGEQFGYQQLIATSLILLGVYLANRKKK